MTLSQNLAPSLASSQRPRICFFAVDSHNVYFANYGTSPNFTDGTVMMVPLDGGTAVALSTGRHVPRTWLLIPQTFTGRSNSGAT